MSYVVKSVEIGGFQHHRDIKVQLRPDVNFIIGRNGTGKTSFIRLLHACLNLDTEELSQIQFAYAEVTFLDTNGKSTPVLRFERSRTSRAYFDIQFKAKRTSKFTSYYSEGDETVSPSGLRILPRSLLSSALGQDGKNTSEYRPVSVLRRELRKNLQFSWLPLLRSRAQKRNEFYVTDQAEEPINRKIKELTAQITTYLSVLDSRVSEANKKFQREIFISYLEKGLWDTGALKELDLEKERQLLIQMFQEMDYPTSDVLEKLHSFFEGTKQTRDALETAKSYSPQDIVNIVTANALHRIVDSFNIYTEEKDRILFPRTRFLKIMNELLYRKSAYFDEGNVLNVKIQGDPTIDFEARSDDLNLFSLSSGERQLLIILSETLLQQQRRYIFIADEPELSLHVEWQEKLVPKIRDINENAQIIFATHSPDVVSIYQSHVIDFESV